MTEQGPLAEQSPLAETAAAGLRVALVHDWLTGMRGGEKVLEEIAAEFPGAPIFTLICFEDTISERLRQHPIHTSFLQRYPRIRNGYRHYLPLFPMAIEDFDLSSFDLIISTSHCVAKGVIPGPDALHLCYCHSPMRYAWDQEHHYFPKRRGVIARLRSVALNQLRTWDAASTSRVDGFWANSNFVGRRIRRFYGRGSEILAPPVDTDFFCPTGGAGEYNESSPQRGTDVESSDDRDVDDRTGEFCLAVSALVPYKRIDLAIQACEEIGMELRIVGTGPERRRLQRLCGRHSQLLDRVSGQQLRQLYRDASFFLQPGIEDFGMASVEAMACGTPVVALGRGGINDIVESERHGVLYQGFEIRDVTAAIDKLLKIRFNKLEIRTRATSFSAGRFRQQLRTSIESRLSQIVESAPTPPETL